MRLSIIIPAIDEALTIGRTLARARAALDNGSGISKISLSSEASEIIVVDGGSSDGTAALAAGPATRVITAARGRANQLNAGAAVATGDVLLFLHADTLLPPDAVGALLDGLDGLDGPDGLAARRPAWGRFDVRIDGKAGMLPVVAWCMNQRSRVTGIATGDQAIFVRRADFQAVGGFPDQPLMEDIELSRRLKTRCAPLCLRQKVVTSGRRWDDNGAWRTIWLMWTRRLRYSMGASAEQLQRAYR